MNIQKIALMLFSCTFLSACFVQETRMSTVEAQLNDVEEKVDALLSYSYKTHDVISDIDLRIETLEKDAKKRGVPVRVKGADIAVVNPKNATRQKTNPATNKQQNVIPQKPNTFIPQAQNVLPKQDMSIAPTQKTTQKNNKLGGNNVMADGITINTGNNSQQQNLQFPAHTESSATPSPQKNKQVLGVITGQNLTQQQTQLTQQQTQLTQQQAQLAQQQQTQLTQQQAQLAQQQQAQLAQQQPQTVRTTSIPKSYDSAMDLYKARQYQQAEQAFNAFLTANPEGVLAPNALYWKGETFYARGNYPQAIFAFKDVQTRYPKHPKAADALLKTAMSYQKLGDVANADLHFLVLKEDFPNSSAAKRIPR